MGSQPTFYTLYRQTRFQPRPPPREPSHQELTLSVYSIGLSLADSIDTLISKGKITQQVAYSVMLQFDRIMAQSLQEKVKTTLTMKVCPPSYQGFRRRLIQPFTAKGES